GAELFRELATDKRFLPYIEAVDSPVAGGPLQVMDIPGGGYLIPQFYPYEPKGDLPPFLQQQRLVWTLEPNPQGQNRNIFRLRVLDKDSSEERWSLTAPPTLVTYNDYTLAMNFNNGLGGRGGRNAAPIVV